jgi:hypothetical protein
VDIKIELSDEEKKSIEKDTIEHAKGANFFRHRAGRIGASVSGPVFHSNLAQPSQTLIRSICYPHLHKVNTKAVKHGRKHEEHAIVTYENEMEKNHVNFEVTRCGIVINKEQPFIHATPAVDWAVVKSNALTVFKIVTLRAMYGKRQLA